MGKNEREAGGVRLSKSQAAALRVRLLPWRPRQRRLDPAKIRENASGVLDLGDDLASMFLSVGIWLALIVTAPLITFALAILLLPFEAGVLAVIGFVLLAVRFAGITHWTVVIAERDGRESVEHYRNVARALRRVRDVNGVLGRAVELLWA